MKKTKMQSNGHSRMEENLAKLGEVTKQRQATIKITPPNFKVAVFTIVGVTPYVQSKFSEKAKEEMKAKQMLGSQANKGKKRAPKDFKACYEASMYRDATEGWNGIPTTQIRAAMIAACRLVDFKMTISKQALDVLPQGFDKTEMLPMIPFTKGKPEYFEQACRNDSGVADIRVRGMWKPGWEVEVKIEYDADMFSFEEVANLLLRAGRQCGIGEGRMNSRKCAGLGWGAFNIKGNGRIIEMDQ